MDLVDIHLTILAVTAVAILYADHLGYQYFTGKREYLDAAVTHRLHVIVSVGLALMILTGVFLTIPLWDYLRDEPVFYVKMGLVLVLVMNSWAIEKLSHLTADRSFSELPQEMQRTLLISGALSAIGWIGATVLSFWYF